jgi:hypothetical protein
MTSYRGTPVNSNDIGRKTDLMRAAHERLGRLAPRKGNRT